MQNILEINGLNKFYGKEQVLKDLNLKIEPGKIVGLLGPNGSGKTTLIKTIMGLITDFEGDIAIAGNAPGEAANSFISYLPDQAHMPKWLKVRECITLFSDFYNDFDAQKAEEMLAKMQIPLHKPLKALSRGMQEKVSLSLIMSRAARLYILDEPIGAVDPASREFILETILTNFDQSGSVLLSTHIIADIEPILDRAFFLREGEVILDGYVDEIREEKGQSLDELFREVFRNAY